MARRSGFTLAEVLVALVIISTVSAAALKLSFLAENSLSEARAEKELVKSAQLIKSEIMLQNISDTGTSGDITWNFQNAEGEFMDKDFGKLDLGGEPTGAVIRPKCMELTVTKKSNYGAERTIKLYAPAEKSMNVQKKSVGPEKEKNVKPERDSISENIGE